jgi:hypothetical protein
MKIDHIDIPPHTLFPWEGVLKKTVPFKVKFALKSRPPTLEEIITKYSQENVEVYYDHFKNFMDTQRIYASTNYTSKIGAYFTTPSKLLKGRWLISGRRSPAWAIDEIDKFTGEMLPTFSCNIIKMFAGRKGSYAHLHYDEDFSPSIHTLLCGKKTLYLFYPEQAPDLALAFNWGRQFPHKDLVSRPCYKVNLAPGDAVFIPPCYWHAVDYDRDSIGFSFRYPTTPTLQFLADEVHSSPLKMLSAWIAASAGDDIINPAIKNIVNIRSESYSPIETYKEIRHVLEHFLAAHANFHYQKLIKTEDKKLTQKVLATALNEGIWYSTPITRDWIFL